MGALEGRQGRAEACEQAYTDPFSGCRVPRFLVLRSYKEVLRYLESSACHVLSQMYAYIFIYRLNCSPNPGPSGFVPLQFPPLEDFYKFTIN